MKRIEYKAVSYVEEDPGDDVQWFYDADNTVVNAQRLRTDDIEPNARGEYLASEIEPLFEPVMPPEVLPGVVTVAQLEAKLDAIKAALCDAALLLCTVRDGDEDEAKDEAFDSDFLVDVDDADEGLGVLAGAWEALEFGGHDEFIDEALKRGGYLKPVVARARPPRPAVDPYNGRSTNMNDDNRGDYEVGLIISGVKEEHVAWTVRALNTLTDFLRLDGTDLRFDLGVERNQDGVERVHEYLNNDRADAIDNVIMAARESLLTKHNSKGLKAAITRLDEVVEGR